MSGTRYATYAPGERDLPWLAVVLVGDKVVDIFPCSSEERAKHVLRDLRARNSEKNGPDPAHA